MPVAARDSTTRASVARLQHGHESRWRMCLHHAVVRWPARRRLRDAAHSPPGRTSGALLVTSDAAW